MNKLFKLSILSLSTLLFTATTAQATSYQVFAALNFSNPAALNSVKDNEIIVGGTGLFSTFHFTGAAQATPGGAFIENNATSNTNDLLPYGRIAKRLSPKVVVGLDITQPYFTNIQYPQFTSPFNLFSTQTILRDVNYSPKLSYQVNERLALGVGFDANNMYNAQLNFAIPPFGNMTNKAGGWAYGWDVGLFYVLTRATFLSISYYSRIVQHLGGTSTWGTTENNSLSADSKLPATFIFNLVHLLSQRLALSGTVRYAQWDTLRFIVLQNTAVGSNITIPYQFYNNVSLELAGRYQLNDKWAALGCIDYEPNVQPTWTRNPGLPTYTRYIPAVGAEYEFIKGLKGKLVYAYVWSRAPINMTIGSGQTIQGTERVHMNAFDFMLTYDI